MLTRVTNLATRIGFILLKKKKINKKETYGRITREFLGFRFFRMLFLYEYKHMERFSNLH